MPGSKSQEASKPKHPRNRLLRLLRLKFPRTAGERFQEIEIEVLALGPKWGYIWIDYGYLNLGPKVRNPLELRINYKGVCSNNFQNHGRRFLYITSNIPQHDLGNYLGPYRSHPPQETWHCWGHAGHRCGDSQN